MPGRMMVVMRRTTYPKCAAPECVSHAREGNVCTYHSGSTYANAPWRHQAFTFIATDPEKDGAPPFSRFARSRSMRPGAQRASSSRRSGATIGSSSAPPPAIERPRLAAMKCRKLSLLHDVVRSWI